MAKEKKVKAPAKDKVEVTSKGKEEVLGPTYEKGRPVGEELGQWGQKLGSRNDILKYLETGQRYFYSEDWFGSEKRKTPA
jgi:hypothetical protein